jgi:hypothetical protein
MNRGALRKPDKRVCERCGRREVWDASKKVWRVEDADDERPIGSRYCIHEWDINGSFVPFEK